MVSSCVLGIGGRRAGSGGRGCYNLVVVCVHFTDKDQLTNGNFHIGFYKYLVDDKLITGSYKPTHSRGC